MRMRQHDGVREDRRARDLLERVEAVDVGGVERAEREAAGPAAGSRRVLVMAVALRGMRVRVGMGVRVPFVPVRGDQVAHRQVFGVGVAVDVFAPGVVVHELQAARKARRERETGRDEPRGDASRARHPRAPTAFQWGCRLASALGRAPTWSNQRARPAFAGSSGWPTPAPKSSAQ